MGDRSRAGAFRPQRRRRSQIQRWVGRYMRLSAPPAASTRMYRWVFQVDVRSVLPSIQAPTLILHREENRHYRAPMGGYLVEHIPAANTSSSQELTGTRPSSTQSRSSTKSKNSSPGLLPRRRRTAFWPPCSSPTSWARPIWQPGLAISAGSNSRPRTTGSYDAAQPLPRERGRHDRGWIPGDLRRPGSRGEVRLRDRLGGPLAGNRRFGQGCTAVKSRSRTVRSPASRSTSPHGSWHLRARGECLSGHSERSSRRFIHSVRRPRVSSAKGHPRRVAPVRGRSAFLIAVSAD